MSPEEIITLLENIPGLSHSQLLALVVGLIVTYLGNSPWAQRSQLLGSSFQITAAAVWAFCWLFLPNALVKVLFPQGPYIIKKTSSSPSLFSLLTQQYSTKSKAQPVWDLFSILLMTVSLAYLVSGIFSFFSPPLTPVEPRLLTAPPIPTPLSNSPFSSRTTSLPPLPARNVSTLKGIMRQVGLKDKFAAPGTQRPLVAILVEDLISLCPAHLKNWVVDFADSCSSLPTTFADFTSLMEEAFTESVTPNVAWASLLGLRQGLLPFSEYVDRFCQCAEAAKASNSVQPILFCQGLPHATQQLLVTVPPSASLDEEISKVTGILQRQKSLPPRPLQLAPAANL